MGQKVNPIGSRLGIIKGWDSNWYGGNHYADKLVEDEKIRKYLQARISKGGISKTIIERTLKRITITIHTARPGIVIGKGGQEVDKIKEELKKITKKDVQINIFEIKRPELDAQLVAEGIAIKRFPVMYNDFVLAGPAVDPEGRTRAGPLHSHDAVALANV